MSRIFLPIYRFFHSHKALMYIAMGLSFVVFICFGLRVQYEEDIFSLMPQQSVESQLAFSSIGLKDKVYLQMAPTDGKMEPEELGALMDELEERLLADDSATGYIDNILAHIDAETGLAALDFVLEHLPTFVDTAAYATIDSALRPEAALAQMEKNQELLLADETGGATQMVAADPLGLRRVIAGDLMAGATAGRTLVGGHFFCPDSSVALAWLAPAFASSDSKTAHRFAKQLAKTTAAFEAEHPEVHILAHGAPLASVANASRIKADLVLTVGVSLVLILILIGFFFRSAGFLLKQLLPIGYGMVFALACVWWIQGSMSLMALGISAIVLGVALSYCLHVTIHHFSTGDPEKMLLDEATPVTMGCITTVGAFCSLLFTDSSLLRDFGLFASLALVGTTFFALVFLPHFMPKRRVETDSRQFRRVLRLNNMPFDRKRWFLILMAAIVVVGVAFAHRVGFDSDLRHLNYKDAQLKEAEALFNAKNNDGYSHLYYATVDADLDAALEADRGLMPILDSLRKEGLVHSYSDAVPRIFVGLDEQQRRIDAWNAYWTPQRRAETMATVRRSAKACGIELNNGGDTAAEAESLYMVFTDVAMLPEDKDAVTEAALANPKTMVLEPFYYCKSLVEVINDDFNVAVWISSLFVLVILLLSFHNIVTALLSFLPMVLSWFMVQGYMALFGLEFNLINIVISTFVFGVGVDYSIFITEGLLAQARTGSSEMLTWHKVAIFFSASILVIVVASLIFAVHPAIRSIGLITLIGMASTIMISYSLQPFAFRQLMKIPAYRKRVLS